MKKKCAKLLNLARDLAVTIQEVQESQEDGSWAL
jgi:hypothetical protein